jgi:hypothetical protein
MRPSHSEAKTSRYRDRGDEEEKHTINGVMDGFGEMTHSLHFQKQQDFTQNISIKVLTT